MVETKPVITKRIHEEHEIYTSTDPAVTAHARNLKNSLLHDLLLNHKNVIFLSVNLTAKTKCIYSVRVQSQIPLDSACSIGAINQSSSFMAEN